MKHESYKIYVGQLNSHELAAMRPYCTYNKTPLPGGGTVEFAESPATDFEVVACVTQK
jgi:hypothetical protein